MAYGKKASNTVQMVARHAPDGSFPKDNPDLDQESEDTHLILEPSLSESCS